MNRNAKNILSRLTFVIASTVTLCSCSEMFFSKYQSHPEKYITQNLNQFFDSDQMAIELKVDIRNSDGSRSGSFDHSISKNGRYYHFTNEDHIDIYDDFHEKYTFVNKQSIFSKMPLGAKDIEYDADFMKKEAQTYMPLLMKNILDGDLPKMHYKPKYREYRVTKNQTLSNGVKVVSDSNDFISQVFSNCVIELNSDEDSVRSIYTSYTKGEKTYDVYLWPRNDYLNWNVLSFPEQMPERITIPSKPEYVSTNDKVRVTKKKREYVKDKESLEYAALEAVDRIAIEAMDFSGSSYHYEPTGVGLAVCGYKVVELQIIPNKINLIYSRKIDLSAGDLKFKVILEKDGEEHIVTV